MTSFPYHKSTRGDYFPVVEFIAYHGNKVIRTSAFIDSGATISVFTPDIADQLGVKIEDGEELYLGGVGGRIRGYIHTIKIEIAGKKFKCPVVFSREYLVSFNLLGRSAFFKQFRIIFEEKKNLLVLE